MKFSIKAKLSAAFTLILLLLISISLLMANKLSDTNNRLTGMVDVSSKKVTLSNEILIAMLEAARQEKNIILEPNLSKKDEYKVLIKEAEAKIDQRVPELESLVDASGKKKLDEFKLIWGKYLDSLDQIIELAYKNETEKAFAISGTAGFNARNQSVILLNQLIEKNKADMINDKKVSDANYDAAIRLIMILIGLSIIAAVITAYWIIKSITGRISNITSEAEKIATREYSDVKVDTSVNDELQPVFASLLSINNSFKEVTQHAFKVASGNYSENFKPKSEKDILGNALRKMTKSLKETTEENEKHNWLATGLNQLSEKLRGDKEVEQLGSDTLSFLCEYTNAQIGALYLSETNDVLEFVAGHAFSGNQRRAFAFKEGLVGEAAYAQKPIYLDVSKEDTLVMNSSLMEKKPNHIIIVPFIFEGKTMGVLEMGSLYPFTEIEKEFINSTLESIAISINSALSRRKIQMLLEETQVQSEELQSQQEELRQMNEELEEQTQSLKQQQEELQITNEELEEQTQALEMKNNEVELARKDIELKNTQIEASSKYKSEFLANMSHELRTPLNSLLILSKDLSENRNDNLTVDQVESAQIIYNSGHDLLNLINEVLDLSKIEAGKMSVNVERIDLKELADSLYRNFKHQAELKKLAFRIEMKDNLPECIMTDRQRLDQILKNILSNAVKFTDKGEITVTVSNNENNTISISIKDTGIGIPKEKQQSVFEAFQQADGGTSRKYGGTGLGLSISRELIKLIGAELQLESEPNKGSVFTLTLPLEYKEEEGVLAAVPAVQLNGKKYSHEDFHNTASIPDDRNGLEEDDKVVLIIEDDLKFATVLLKQAHQKGFKGIVGATGEAGLLLAERFRPHAIIMDMNLPGINGESLLNEIKENPVLRHIPVHIISGEDRSLEMIKKGAIEYFRKPVGKGQLEEAFNRIENFISRKMKNLLIVETDAESRLNMCNLIGNGDVKCLQAQTGKEALEIYGENHIDCIVLDIDLEDMNGFTLIKELERLKPGGMPPIIVYTGRMLTKEENDELEKSTETIIIKGTKSEERLLDETALFLHRAISALPESKQKMISNLHDRDALFKNKKIILTDDDMRNVFALSKVLKERGIEVLKAENGKRAIEMLENNPDANLILMDIMMPEMDGYEAIKHIRLQSRFKNLPIIALTAKAMKEDRQKCIDAGANDYITKPVDVERLLSLMRVWLSK